MECQPTPISTLYSTSTTLITTTITTSSAIVVPASPSFSTILVTDCPSPLAQSLPSTEVPTPSSPSPVPEPTSIDASASITETETAPVTSSEDGPDSMASADTSSQTDLAASSGAETALSTGAESNLAESTTSAADGDAVPDPPSSRDEIPLITSTSTQSTTLNTSAATNDAATSPDTTFETAAESTSTANPTAIAFEDSTTAVSDAASHISSTSTTSEDERGSTTSSDTVSSSSTFGEATDEQDSSSPASVSTSAPLALPTGNDFISTLDFSSATHSLLDRRTSVRPSSPAVRASAPPSWGRHQRTRSLLGKRRPTVYGYEDADEDAERGSNYKAHEKRQDPAGLECTTITSISAVQGVESTSFSPVLITTITSSVVSVPTETVFQSCSDTTTTAESSSTELPTTTSLSLLLPTGATITSIPMSSSGTPSSAIPIVPVPTSRDSSLTLTDSSLLPQETSASMEESITFDSTLGVEEPDATEGLLTDTGLPTDFAQSTSPPPPDRTDSPTQNGDFTDSADEQASSSDSDLQSSDSTEPVIGGGLTRATTSARPHSAEHQASLTYKPYPTTSASAELEATQASNKALSAGAAVGGFFAFVALIAAILFVIRFWKRRQRAEKTKLIRSSWFYGAGPPADIGDENEKRNSHHNPSPAPQAPGLISRFSAPSLVSRRSMFFPAILARPISRLKHNSMSAKSRRSNRSGKHNTPFADDEDVPALPVLASGLLTHRSGTNADGHGNDEGAGNNGYGSSDKLNIPSEEVRQEEGEDHPQSRFATALAPFKALRNIALPTFPAGLLSFKRAEHEARDISDPVPIPLPNGGSGPDQGFPTNDGFSKLLPIFSAFRTIRQSLAPSRRSKRSSTENLRYVRQSAARGSPAWAEKYPDQAPIVVGEAWLGAESTGEAPRAAMMQPPTGSEVAPPMIGGTGTGGYGATILGMGVNTDEYGPYPHASALSTPLAPGANTGREQTLAQLQGQLNGQTQFQDEDRNQPQRQSVVQLRHMTWGSSYAPRSGVPQSASGLLGGTAGIEGLPAGGVTGPGMFMTFHPPSEGSNSIYSRNSMQTASQNHSQSMCHSETSDGGGFRAAGYITDADQFPLPPMGLTGAFSPPPSHTPSPPPAPLPGPGSMGTYPRSILSPRSAGSNGSRGSLLPPPPIREIGGSGSGSGGGGATSLAGGKTSSDMKRVTRSTTRSSGIWEYAAYVDSAGLNNSIRGSEPPVVGLGAVVGAGVGRRSSGASYQGPPMGGFGSAPGLTAGVRVGVGVGFGAGNRSSMGSEQSSQEHGRAIGSSLGQYQSLGQSMAPSPTPTSSRVVPGPSPGQGPGAGPIRPFGLPASPAPMVSAASPSLPMSSVVGRGMALSPSPTPSTQPPAHVYGFGIASSPLGPRPQATQMTTNMAITGYVPVGKHVSTFMASGTPAGLSRGLSAVEEKDGEDEKDRDRVTRHWYEKPLWDRGFSVSNNITNAQNNGKGTEPGPRAGHPSAMRTASESGILNNYHSYADDRMSVQTAATAGTAGDDGKRASRKSMKSVKSVRWEDSPVPQLKDDGDGVARAF